MTAIDSIPGAVVGSTAVADTEFRVVVIDGAVTWIEGGAAGDVNRGGTLRLAQGADVMPRRLFFFHTEPRAGGRVFVRAIEPTDPERYLVSDEKQLTTFKPPETTVPSSAVFDVLISKHLGPFVLADPAQAVLPLHREDGAWSNLDPAVVAADSGMQAVFGAVVNALRKHRKDDEVTPLDAIESARRKLTAQAFDADGVLVVQGVGGEVATAAARPLDSFDPARLIVDQTLAWTVVEPDHADYLVGALNSPAIARLLKGFNPEGEQGGRHLHSRPARLTPAFDADDSLHGDVVRSTRDLVAELSARLSDLDPKYLAPSSNLPARRRKMRLFIEGLAGYPEYVRCTNALFGLPD